MLTRIALFLGISLLGTLNLAYGANALRGADKHASHGVSCQACHGEDLKHPQTPTLDTCTRCHALQALVAKTAKVKPTNPHTSPHYGDQLDCVNCHIQHEDTENFCASCHSFDFKVP